MQTEPKLAINDILLKEVVGEWHVSVRERGHEPWTRVFYDQMAAAVFAQAQKTRLGLRELRFDAPDLA
jgi:hypothetical protein